jgi:hypothetical protein
MALGWLWRCGLAGRFASDSLRARGQVPGWGSEQSQNKQAQVSESRNCDPPLNGGSVYRMSISSHIRLVDGGVSQTNDLGDYR